MKTTFVLFISLFVSSAYAVFPRISIPTESAVDKVVVGGKGVCDAPVMPGSIEEAVQKYTIQVLANGRPHCTGTAISPSHVMLAKHCIPPEDKKTKYTVRVYVTKKVNGQSQGEYVEYKTVGKTTSLSQSRDDMGMLLLDKEMPAENVPPLMKQGTTCKNDEWVQAGFGLDGNAQAPKCPRFARYKTVTSRAVYGLGVAGGSQYVFFAVPKDKKAKDTGLGCNGDSGGPLYCQVGGRWVYSGLMTSSIPHTSKNEKGEDVPDAAWVAPSKICENVTDAEENAKAACDNEKLSAEDRKKACDSLPAIQQPRRNACAEACKLAYAIGGYRISEVHDNIGYMKDYLPLPEKTKSGSKVQEYEN